MALQSPDRGFILQSSLNFEAVEETNKRAKPAFATQEADVRCGSGQILEIIAGCSTNLPWRIEGAIKGNKQKKFKKSVSGRQFSLLHIQIPLNLAKGEVSLVTVRFYFGIQRSPVFTAIVHYIHDTSLDLISDSANNHSSDLFRGNS